MLRTRLEFSQLQAGGRSRADRLLSVRIGPNPLGHDRFGISTGRALGGAVQRNRVRRRIREALRSMDTASGAGRDILVVARPPSVAASTDELRAVLLRLVGPLHGPAPEAAA